MAANTKNKYPTDKAGTKYSEFKNTKRTPPAKAKSGGSGDAKQGAPETDQTTGKRQ